MNKHQLFHESLYDFATLQPSWWEESARKGALEYPRLKQDIQCDVAIIGGGYTGLSAAYHLAKEYGIDAVVLEAGEIGWGSSGRNGGFCCMGGTLYGAKSIARKFGLDEAKRFYAVQREAVELVAAIGEAEGIDFEKTGASEMVVAETPSHFEDLKEEHAFLTNELGVACNLISKDEFAKNCYDSPHQHGAMAQSPGFGLHPLKYCLGLAESAKRYGVRLFGRSEVAAWEKPETGGAAKHQLRTAGGHSVTVDNVIVACNGFMPEKLSSHFRSRILPLQSQIIVTRPLTDDEISAHNWVTADPAINSRNIYFYYRMLPDRRFLIGGRADFSGTPEGARKTAFGLQQSLGRLWPEWSHLEIEYDWRGFVCFTGDLRPAMGRIEDDPSIYFAFGYHGNGVNNATWCGRELARWLATGNNKTNPVPDHLPALYRGMTRRIPFGGLRTYYTRAGVGWLRFMDRLSGIR